MNHCADLRYTKSHEWFFAPTATARPSGIRTTPRWNWATLFTWTCPRRAGLPEQSDVFGAVESVKAISDLYAPVSGEVVERRGADPRRRRLTRTLYSRGWIIVIKATNPAEIDGLMTRAAHNGGVAPTGWREGSASGPGACSPTWGSGPEHGLAPTPRRRGRWRATDPSLLRLEPSGRLRRPLPGPAPGHRLGLLPRPPLGAARRPTRGPRRPPPPGVDLSLVLFRLTSWAARR